MSLTPMQIVERLRAELGQEAIHQAHDRDRHPRVHTDAEHWRALAEKLYRDPELAFDWLCCLTAVDYPTQEQLCAVYDLRSMSHGHRFAVKVGVPREQPVIPSVGDLWSAALWHEREAYDLMGITFTDHPDLRRILLPEDWPGHPLRKDYVFPRAYHGIPMSTELDWQQKPDYPG
jgi:NADH-quinone oxidoreductase subunit C